MKAKILKILRNADGYISGQAICDLLCISRTAVWKYINQLKDDGYVFDAVSNKGYRIIQYPDIVTKAEIESTLEEGVIEEVFYYDETDSTNNRAKKAAEEGAKTGSLFITECQTGGRGRRGRRWVSPAGSGIWMSLLLRPDIKPFDASMLTIVAAIATAKAIEEVTNKSIQEQLENAKEQLNNVQEQLETNVSGDNEKLNPQCKKSMKCGIKWPNDIVINKHKVCGMLTEMSAETDCVNYVVIGIGINVNTENFDDSIKDVASSLYVETGIHIKRSRIVASFSKHFRACYDKFLEHDNLSGVVDEYNAMLVNIGKQVKVVGNESEDIVIAKGIDETGNLIVEHENGSQERIMAGEVSVRGLYGYV